ncbi:MAG: hypothetical protein NZ839_00540 [Endomicrobia bacterium]|nr:hypothetical protein [Endomicrobiia bacterium]
MEDFVKEELTNIVSMLKEDNITIEDAVKGIVEKIANIIPAKEEQKTESKNVEEKEEKEEKKEEEKEMEDISSNSEIKYISKKLVLFPADFPDAEKVVEDILKYKPPVFLEHSEDLSGKVFIKDIKKEGENYIIELVGEENLLADYEYCSVSLVKDSVEGITTVSEVSLTKDPKAMQKTLEISKYSASWEILPAVFKKFILITNDLKQLEVINRKRKQEIQINKKDIKEILIEEIIKELGG